MGGMESYVIESYFYIDSPKFASSLGFVQFSKQCRLALSNLRTPEKNIGICSERSPFPSISCASQGHPFALMMVPPQSLAKQYQSNISSAPVSKNFCLQPQHLFQQGA